MSMVLSLSQAREYQKLHMQYEKQGSKRLPNVVTDIA